MAAKPAAVRPAPAYRSRVRLVPLPKGHDLDAGFQALAEIGRRSLAPKATP